ncbi:MAG: sigma-70 family RNA polymerase sigma factor [Oscillospiraceae bacterium]|nr:sigma-70 family RNA polymerase sigma factor [Oscillospiraceae bacterium]
MMEFTFEPSPWELTLMALKPGDTLYAARCIAMLQDLSEEEAEDALLSLDEKHITLNITDLPVDIACGEAAERLKWERKITQTGDLRSQLEENDPLRLYLEEIKNTPESDWKTLARRYAGGDDEAAQGLVQICLPLVVKRACAATGRGVLLMDLIQEGNLGLWQGILNYTDGDFEEHILWWIDQYICKAIILQARSGEVGQKFLQGMADFRDADQKLLGELGRNPTVEEIAEAIHCTPAEAMAYGAMLDQARIRRQVDDLQKPKEENSDDEQSVENTAYFQMRQRILDMLSALNEREAKLLTLRFGLEGGVPMDPRQVGQAMGLTAEEVTQIEAAALQKLRQQ